MNVQMLIALMQAHGVRRVIVSPGTTHMELVAGLQFNGGFDMYSSIDERGAAYMACGMAAKTGEPVAIICTESVASRNYASAMTFAYYNQLPVLAITGLHGYAQIGHLNTQVIDRSVSPSDMFRLKVQLPLIKDEEDIWESNVLINRALLELRHRGGGPVHIDLPISKSRTFSVKQLQDTRVIRRYCPGDRLPSIAGGYIRPRFFLGHTRRLRRRRSRRLTLFVRPMTPLCSAATAAVTEVNMRSCQPWPQARTRRMTYSRELSC